MSIWLALLMSCRPMCAAYKLVSDKEFVQFRDIKGVKNFAKKSEFLNSLKRDLEEKSGARWSMFSVFFLLKA